MNIRHKPAHHQATGSAVDPLLELYRVVPGELCLVSSACLFRTQPLSARGVTTKASTLIMAPPEIFTRLLRRFEREGWVTLGREQIQITNSAGLRDFCHRRHRQHGV